MPELPDLTVYLEALERRAVGDVCASATIVGPFVLRSVDPPISSIAGKQLKELRRIGKQIVFAFESDLFVVIHLMVAGRLQWSAKKPKPHRHLMLALFDFPHGTLVLTEAGTKKRASIHVVRGEAALEQFSRGGTVTACRDDMAVHGKYGKPCPICGSPIQRIRYADNETNYCATCQTGGRLLADRAISRLLKEYWPRTLQEMEEMEEQLGSA